MTVVDLARPTHRLIVCVQESTLGSDSDTVADLNSIIAKLDPTSQRTLFVFTKLDKILAGSPATDQLNSSFQRNKPKDCFWVTTISDEQNLKQRRTENEYQNTLAELQKKDRIGLERLHYDKT
jgi:hypothetical protein